MIRNVRLTAALSAALLLSSTGASAQGASDTWFVDARVGEAAIDEGPFDGDAVAVQLVGGYRWESIGVEVGYLAGDTIEARHDFRSSDGPLATYGLDLDGVLVGLNGRLPVGDRWAVTGRGGAFVWNADATATHCAASCQRADISSDGTDFYAGLGLTFAINDRFDVGVAGDFFRVALNEDRAPGDPSFDADVDADVVLFSLTAAYRF